MLKSVDLFCGGGFGARGAVKAGATPILAVDAWQLAASTYESNFSAAEVICAARIALEELIDAVDFAMGINKI